MIAVRVHLDPCDSENGPLRVIPGSHRSGKLSDRQLAAVGMRNAAVELCAARGAILLMRPLLVHSSSPARVAAHRRVLHVELAPREAISPLLWHSAIPLRRGGVANPRPQLD